MRSGKNNVARNTAAAGYELYTVFAPACPSGEATKATDAPTALRLRQAMGLGSGGPVAKTTPRKPASTPHRAIAERGDQGFDERQLALITTVTVPMSPSRHKGAQGGL